MASNFVQANTGGTLHSADDASIRPVDRGFLYGDAVYEVWRTYDKRIFAWDEHWARLKKSGNSIHLHIPWADSLMMNEIIKTGAAFRKQTGHRGEVYIRLQISRGGGSIGLDIDLAESPEFVILVKPVPVLSAEIMQKGLKLTVAQTIRRNPPLTLNPAWKTGNYLNNIMGLREAKQRGANDVLFLNLNGELTEASTSNVAFIVGNSLVTPPLEAGVLPGITRAHVIKTVAQSAGLSVDERPISPAELETFDEAMLLSTTKDVQPVGLIDGFRYRVDREAKLWRLKTEFQAFAANSVSRRPELSVQRTVEDGRISI